MIYFQDGAHKFYEVENNDGNLAKRALGITDNFAQSIQQNLKLKNLYSVHVKFNITHIKIEVSINC